VGFLECLCDGDGGRKWQFIGGRGDRAGALYRRAGAPLKWHPWMQLFYSLLCLVFTPKIDSWVVVGRWKLSGEWRYVGGSNNVMRYM